MICRITGLYDGDIEVHFVYESGPSKGSRGYTLLPQNVEIYGILDQLADI